MTDYIAKARQAHNDHQATLQQQAAEQRARREAAQRSQEALLEREHGEQCSTALARILEADPSEPEFRELIWRAIGVELNPAGDQYTWDGDLETNFQGVTIRARRRAWTDEQSYGFHVVDRASTTGFDSLLDLGRVLSPESS